MATFGRPKGKFYKAPTNKRISEDDDPYEKVTLMLPKGLLERIMVENAKKPFHERLSLSHLVTIACDNELEAQNPFEFAVNLDFENLPPRVEYEFAEEAGRMLEFLRGFHAGVAPVAIFHLRHNYGVPDMEKARGAYRELIETGLIEVFEKRWPVHKLMVRVITGDARNLKKAKYKRIEGESQKGVRSVYDGDVE